MSAVGLSVRRARLAAVAASLLAACGSAGDGGLGSVHVVGSAKNCPTIGSLSISPAELDVGGSGEATLTASAAVPGGGTINYAWSATSGVLGSPSSATTTFACTSPALVTVMITATSGGCSDHASGTIACLALDAGSTWND
jgi:hypothetical protein